MSSTGWNRIGTELWPRRRISGSKEAIEAAAEQLLVKTGLLPVEGVREAITELPLPNTAKYMILAGASFDRQDPAIDTNLQDAWRFFRFLGLEKAAAKLKARQVEIRRTWEDWLRKGGARFIFPIFLFPGLSDSADEVAADHDQNIRAIIAQSLELRPDGTFYRISLVQNKKIDRDDDGSFSELLTASATHTQGTWEIAEVAAGDDDGPDGIEPDGGDNKQLTLSGESTIGQRLKMERSSPEGPWSWAHMGDHGGAWATYSSTVNLSDIRTKWTRLELAASSCAATKINGTPPYIMLLRQEVGGLYRP